MVNVHAAGAIGILDADRYPKLLRKVASPPETLYYRGNWDVHLFDTALAVVGSRRMSIYGKRCVDFLVGEAVRYGITVVSGFMYGVDMAAHRRCIEVGGKTVAVLPCGLGYPYEGEEFALYREILDSGGLVVSEYKETISPQKWLYPKRNRIVAGLSNAALVIEAGLKSGSLITADITTGLGREVLAVPGPIFSPVSQGTAELIKKGAHLACSGCDIREVLEASDVALPSPISLIGSKTLGDSSSPSKLSDIEKRILNILKTSSLTTDEIGSATNLDLSELNKVLTFMILADRLFELDGRYYVK